MDRKTRYAKHDDDLRHRQGGNNPGRGFYDEYSGWAYWAFKGAYVFAGDGDDWIYGGYNDDTIHGEGGNDHIFGKHGNDILIGGDGDDWYYVGWDKSTDFPSIVEGKDGGYDSVDSYLSFALPDHVERLFLEGNAWYYGYGNQLDNVIIGNGAPNELDGAGGDDRLEGGGGDDLLRGGPGNDTLVFGSNFGNDVVADFDQQGDTDLIQFDHKMFADFEARNEMK